MYSTVEPGYSEVHKSDQSFHYNYYFTIARVKYMCVVETVHPVASEKPGFQFTIARSRRKSW